MPAVSAATGQVLSTGSPVDHGHRLASYYTSLVVSGGVHCGRRRRNVYDKKPQRYAKDNRTAHLTALSDKSVAYVTKNKRLYSTFYRPTVEASSGLFATAELLVLLCCGAPQDKLRGTPDCRQCDLHFKASRQFYTFRPISRVSLIPL